jgi:hypothetical protein
MRFFLVIVFLLSWMNAFALTETDRQEAVFPNLYGNNAGFENGVKDITVSSAVKNWSSTKHLGNKGASCTNDYCETKTVCNGDAAANLEWGFYYRTTSSTLKAEILDAANNVVRRYSVGTTEVIPSNTGFNEMILEWAASASTCYKLRFTQTTATASTIYWDTMHVSKNTAVGTVAQAEWVGKVNFDTSCEFAGGNTSFNSNNDGSCGITTTGNISSIAGYFGFTLPQNKNGRYIAIISGGYGLRSTDNSGVSSYRFSDAVSGGNIASEEYTFLASNGFNTNNGLGSSLSFNKTTSGNYYLQFKTSGSGVNVTGPMCNFSGCEINVYRFPSASEQVVRAESSSAAWSGYFTAAGQWSTTSTSYADMTAIGTQTLTERENKNFGTVSIAATNQPGITFTPPVTGLYYVCMTPQIQNTTGNNAYVRLFDGTTELHASNALYVAATVVAGQTLCAFKNVTSLSPVTLKIQMKTGSGTVYIANNGNPLEISIFALTQQVPMPQIINSVSTKYNGQLTINALEFGGNTSTNECTSDPCTIYNSTGTWASSVNLGATGQYTVNFVAGTFSSAPVCLVSGSRNVTRYPNVNAPTTTSALSISVKRSDDNSAVNDRVNVICIGPK